MQYALETTAGHLDTKERGSLHTALCARGNVHGHFYEVRVSLGSDLNNDVASLASPSHPLRVGH